MPSSRARVASVLITAGALVAALVPFAGLQPALAATADCAFDAELGRTAAVTAVGLPSADAVDYRVPGGTPLAGRLAGPAGSGFGSAVASTFLDAGHCADLAVGAPRRPGGGEVLLYLGTPAGYPAQPWVRLKARTAADRFGSSVVLRERPAGGVDIWVGVPGRTVSGRTGAGAVDHYRAAPGQTPVLQESVTAASAGAGAAQRSAAFGSVLTASAEGLLVGVPRQDVRGRADAGAAYWFASDRGTGRVVAGRRWTQDSAGVAGGPERGDRFGASVALSRTGSPRWVLVGVPGEDLGRRVDAGSVQSFRLDAGRRSLSAGGAVDQGSPGVPGTVAAGDRFGAAVAVDDGSCLGGGWLVGSPGEDAGGKRDAGTFATVAPTGSGCHSRVLDQRELSQHDETGDQFGAAIAVGWQPSPQVPVTSFGGYLIGAPGEDLDGIRDLGVLTSWGQARQCNPDGSCALTSTYQFFPASGRRTAGLRYGAVLDDADTHVRR